jgi:hypothetical protein
MPRSMRGFLLARHFHPRPVKQAPVKETVKKSTCSEEEDHRRGPRRHHEALDLRGLRGMVGTSPEPLLANL